MIIPRIACLIFAGLVLAGPGGAQTFFTDVTDGSFSVSFSQLGGMTFGDYNNDGWPDLFVAEGANSSNNDTALLQNLGTGRFADRTDRLPADPELEANGSGAIFGDFDNDGDLDLFVPQGAFKGRGRDRLWRNDRGVFRDVSQEAGLTDHLPTDNAIWLDYDRDGHLDLYTGRWVETGDSTLDPSTLRNALFRNRGDGTFEETTHAAGLGQSLYAGTGFAHLAGGSAQGMVAADFNDDGWPDLYLSVFLAPNRLFINHGQGGFQDATTEEIGDSGQAFGVAVGDVNNDGTIDIFQAAGGSGGDFRSLMLLNLGRGQFADFTEALGLGALGSSNTLGTLLVDLDNDGDLDLVTGQPHFVFLNNGDGLFEDATDRSGLSQISLDLVFADYDLDGFLDVAFRRDQAQVSWGGLFRNNGNANHYLRVELVGLESNRQGIGARLLASSGDRVQRRDILGGNGFTLGETTAHFGLGSRTMVERLEIRWPSGRVDVLTDIPADQKIRVVEGQAGYHTVQPTRWTVPPPLRLGRGRTTELAASIRPAQFLPEARVTQVQADLRPLGGPARVPLVASDDGTYRLETTLTVNADPGVKTLDVQIEQQTDLGPYWGMTSWQVVVVPDGDSGIFDDRVDQGWAVEAQWLNNVSRHPAVDVGSTWVGTSERLTFATNRDGDWEVYMADADGSNVVNFTNDPANDLGGLGVSPDGRKIAFTSDRDGQTDIYTADVDGANLMKLTDDVATEEWIGWSPDSGRILFHARDEEGNRDIYVIDADGAQRTRLTQHGAFDGEARWSPDNRQIVFSSNRDGDREIWVMDADGGNPVQLTHNLDFDGHPDWAPDGRYIVFTSDRDGQREIYLMEPDGSNPRRLTHHPELEGWPTWSPDSRRISFTSVQEGNWEIYVMEPAGTERVVVDPTQNAVVYDGNTALAVQADKGVWKVLFHTAAPVDPALYKGLHLALHPGDTQVPDTPLLHVTLNGQVVNILDEALDGGIDLTDRGWQAVVVPLAGVNERIETVVISGNLHGTAYLDDVRLVSLASTAVVESFEDMQPQDFALEQNFPNPFNPETVIRFGLPAPEAVDLAVYNVTGQKVATLVQGLRRAGAYAVRWDGRDDDGRPLASGVYVYRLRAGGRVQTQKLLMLK